jgi:endonuclease/exonuclease/phosphatase family metal-dependent hydrolase
MVPTLVAGLTIAAVPFLSLHEASARGRGRFTGNRVLVVSVNLRETAGGDTWDDSDVEMFVRRMLRQVPRSPDVLALQEVSAYSARHLAALLTRKAPGRFVVAVNAGSRPWRRTGRGRAVGRDSAIVVNKKTVSVGGGGYMRLSYPASKAAPGYPVRTKYHAYALVKKRGGRLALPVVSIHFPRAKTFVSWRAAQKIKTQWTHTITRRLGRSFKSDTARRSRVLAGDFNNSRCMRDSNTCKQTPAYRAAKRLGYTDSVVALKGSGNPIDFIFSKAPVVNARTDQTAGERKREYSDHPFRWALLERKDRTAPTPPGHISRSKGTGQYVRLRGWKRARDGGTGFAHFKIRRSVDGPKSGFHDIGTTRKRRFEDRRVERGRRYWYRVVAVDRADNPSRKSPAASARAGVKKIHSGPGPKVDVRKKPDFEAWFNLPDTPRLNRPGHDPPSPEIDRPGLDPPPNLPPENPEASPSPSPPPTTWWGDS